MKHQKWFHQGLCLCLCYLLFGSSLPVVVHAQNKDRVIVINADQPNVWTLEQAHYLLAQMHRRDLDLKTKRLEDLDPNTINGLRFDVLQTLVELGANFNQANALTNKILARNKQVDAERRTQLISDRKKLRDESVQLTREISELQSQKATAKTQEEKDQLDAQIAAKTDLRAKIDKEVEFDDNEIKTLGDSSGDFKSTDAQVQFDASKFPKSIFGDAFKDAAKALIDRFNSSPTLNASMMLQNVLDLQYEIVSKQLTLLRDEVGPGERLLFLELPQTVNAAHHEADQKWAQSWWKIKGYEWREPTSRPTPEGSVGPRYRQNRPTIKAIEDYNATVQTNEQTVASKATNLRTVKRGFVNKFADLDKAELSPELQTALASDKATFTSRVIRTVELIPRQSSLNVNDLKLRTKSGAFSFVASFLFGFGARLNVQRQREQFSQFVQQELYSSAFGKGSREFGWTFTPMPGTDRLLSGDRTTYAAIIVPDNATKLLLESNGCYFPRGAYQPTDFADTVSDRWEIGKRTSRNCGEPKAYLVQIPSGGEDAGNDFWVEGVSYQPVPQGGRIVVTISGSNFSSQLGVLISGIALTPAIGLAQPLLRDDSKAGEDAGSESKLQAINGAVERVDDKAIVFSFVMPSDFTGTPTITLIAPGKAIDINWLENIGINGEEPATLAENLDPKRLCNEQKKTDCLYQAAWMFGKRPDNDFKIDSVELFRRHDGKLSAMIRGKGFVKSASAKLFVNGVQDDNWVALNEELIQVSLIEAPSDNTIRFTLVDGAKSANSETIDNPGLSRVSKVGIISYEARDDRRPGVLVARIEGVGFTNGLKSEDPRIRVTVISSTEAYVAIENPAAVEVVSLADSMTGSSVQAVITRP